jgi:DNA anti-recombination protein RmuC
MKMNFRKLTALAVVAMIVAVPATPAFAVSKEIIQLQTQVQDLADRIAHMQQSFDERMGVMRNLVEQSTDNVNKLSESVQTMQKSLQQQNAPRPRLTRSRDRFRRSTIPLTNSRRALPRPASNSMTSRASSRT